VREIEVWAEAAEIEWGGPEPECKDGCVRGVCVSGKCVCHPDWIGESCDHNLYVSTWYAPVGEASASHHIGGEVRRGAAKADGGFDVWGHEWKSAYASLSDSQMMCPRGAITLRSPNPKH
jgi:hypothetical protein